MNIYLKELSDLNNVKLKNQTIEKIHEVNLAFNSLREDIKWFDDHDWYLSNEQAKQIKVIKDFVFSNTTIDKDISE